MNKRIKELYGNALDKAVPYTWHNLDHAEVKKIMKEFAELILEECRTVINDVYHKTPLELCGPLLTADEEISKHFYGVEE